MFAAVMPGLLIVNEFAVPVVLIQILPKVVSGVAVKAGVAVVNDCWAP